MFDVGETLVDETRAWGSWADWLGVPRLTLFAILGGVVERGEDHRRAFEIARPGIDLRAEIDRQRAVGREYRLRPEDLYPDAVPALRSLAAAGYRIGVAANQPVTTEQMLEAVDVPLELIASSDRWGVAKPEPGFFARVASELGLEPGAIAYVGDRVDNDIRPAAAAGMLPIHVRRGPWGFAHADAAEAAGAMATIDSLAEVEEVLARLSVAG